MDSRALSMLHIGMLCAGMITPVARADDAGTGPAVGQGFAAATFDVPGQPESVFVAWRDDQARIHSGLLRLDDESFVAFPVQPTPENYVTNLSVGVGGPANARRAYVAWVGNQLDLWLLVFDASGSVIAPPHTVASAVQVVPIRFAGTDTGALIGYSWGAHPAWDPRVLRVDLQGAALVEEVPQDVVGGQTLGVDVAATPDGSFGAVYVRTGGGATASLRRYDANVPLEAPVLVSANYPAAGYDPFVFLVSPAAVPPFLFLALRETTAGQEDLRFATTTLVPSPVTLGPLLSQLSPTFAGSLADVAALSGTPELVVALRQEVLLQDPCVCSAPPPARVEYIAQVVTATIPPQAFGPPFTVHLWQQGDAFGTPLASPVIAPSEREAGKFTVLWTDGLLRYKRASALPLGTSFCFGTAPACPCGNAGVIGHGCESSIGTGGGLLEAGGNASVGSDSLGLVAMDLPPTAPALFFQGTEQVNGGVGVAFGDGLRCVGGTVIRLATKISAAGTARYPEAGDASVSARGLIPAGGGTRHYQTWYRNVAPFCTPASYNLTNGLTVIWIP